MKEEGPPELTHPGVRVSQWGTGRAFWAGDKHDGKDRALQRKEARSWDGQEGSGLRLGQFWGPLQRPPMRCDSDDHSHPKPS